MARKKYEEPVTEEMEEQKELFDGGIIEKTQPEPKRKLITTEAIYTYSAPTRTRRNTLPITKGRAFTIEGEVDTLSGKWYKIGFKSYVPEGNGYIIK